MESPISKKSSHKKKALYIDIARKSGTFQETPTNFTDILDDLSIRFIVNLPPEELQSLEHICFHLEEALWFYEDFYRDQNNALPSLNLKDFAKLMFDRCPLLRPHLQTLSIDKIISMFNYYKARVPICGVILLNDILDKVLLVKGYQSGSWGFPKGKINKEEKEIDCASREAYEEIGFNTREILNEADSFEKTFAGRKIRFFIASGIPEDTKFNPQTRKEIAKIKWIPIKKLPQVRIPKIIFTFVSELLTWIQAKQETSKAQRNVPAECGKQWQSLSKPSSSMMSMQSVVNSEGERLENSPWHTKEAHMKENKRQDPDSDPWLFFRFNREAILNTLMSYLNPHYES